MRMNRENILLTVFVVFVVVVVGGDGLPLLFSSFHYLSFFLFFWRPLLDIYTFCFAWQQGESMFCQLHLIFFFRSPSLTHSLTLFSILNLSQQTFRRCYFKRVATTTTTSTNNDEKKNLFGVDAKTIGISK